mgnify:CR=1 FL=1
MFWALVVIITTLVTASDIWGKLDDRIAEAAKDSIGFDTAVSSNYAIKKVSLMFIATFAAVLSAYSFAFVSEELIKLYDWYATNGEACSNDTNSGKPECSG